MQIEKALSMLSDASGTALNMTRVSEIVSELGRKYGRVYTDKTGNIYVEPVSFEGKQQNILIDAHLDEIGLVVTEIDKNGFIKVASAGAVDRRQLYSAEVTVLGREEIYGVFTTIPPHLAKKESPEVPEISDFSIDTGYSPERVRELVKPGDAVVFRTSFKKLTDDIVTSKALDNRAGVTALLYAMELLSKASDIKSGVTFLFSVQEEIGLRGATVGGYRISPTHSICVDVSYGYTPDSPRVKCGELGKGPMIGISPILSKNQTDKLLDIAKENGIPYQLEVMGGKTGTNADAISISGSGVETMLISIPLKYMHSAVETVSLSDIENTGRLIYNYIISI